MTDFSGFLRDAVPLQQDSIAPHELDGQRVWLKKAGPRNPRWRYAVMGALASAFKLDVLQPVMNLGGEDAIAHEARRLRELAALDLRVPALLAEQPDGLLIADLGTRGQPAETLLTHLAAAMHVSPQATLAEWKRGVDAIALVHSRGSYLSQAFIRNMVVCPDGVVGYIDFEDDPGATLPLAQCQARDWLSYIHSTAKFLMEMNLFDDAGAIWLGTQQLEGVDVRRALQLATARMQWMRSLPSGPRWGNDTARLRAAALFLSAVSGVSGVSGTGAAPQRP